jgi:transposase
MKNTIVAVDLAKNVYEIAVSEEPGRVSEHHRVSPLGLINFFAKRARAIVVMEACGSAHLWGRKIQAFGHQVVLLPPHLVKPYRSGNKHDQADAKALLEAYRNEQIHPVPVKSVAQHTLAALHRLRSGWLATRTARINAVRGVLRELGIFIPKGAERVVPEVSRLLEDEESDIPDALRPFLSEACSEIRKLETRMKSVERQLKALSKQLPEVQRLAAA